MLHSSFYLNRDFILTYRKSFRRRISDIYPAFSYSLQTLSIVVDEGDSGKI